MVNKILMAEVLPLRSSMVSLVDLIVIRLAQVMVGQRPDNVAVAHMVGVAMGRNPLELRLQLLQLRDLLAYRRKLLRRNTIGFRARLLGMPAEVCLLYTSPSPRD